MLSEGEGAGQEVCLFVCPVALNARFAWVPPLLRLSSPLPSPRCVGTLLSDRAAAAHLDCVGWLVPAAIRSHASLACSWALGIAS